MSGTSRIVDKKEQHIEKINPFFVQKVAGELDNFNLRVSKGEIPGHSFIHKFGENPSVSSVEEVVWDKGGMYEYLNTAQQLSVQSTSSGDSQDNVGAWQIRIEGLDENYIEITEVITLQGLISVITSNSFIRVFRMTVISTGTSQKASGTISVTYLGITLAQIIDGNNQTLMSLYTIPAGKTGYLIKGKAGATAGKTMSGSFFIRDFGSVFKVAHRFYIYQNNYEYFFSYPIPLEEKSDIEVRVISSSSGGALSAAFDILLIDN